MPVLLLQASLAAVELLLPAQWHCGMSCHTDKKFLSLTVCADCRHVVLLFGAAAGVEDVQARYTFIYRKINDKWFIAEHHSSAMPEK
jgi:hypothetical protein